jgi:hypothetical protein
MHFTTGLHLTSSAVWTCGLPGTPTAMIASTTHSELRRCLKDVIFPASKKDLLEIANRSGCDDETARALQALTPGTYNNLAQVASSVTITDSPNTSTAEV